MTQVFITVLNMSIIASYVAIFVVVARLLLKKTPKVFSYGLWAIVFFRMVCPFSFENIFSLLPKSTNAIPQNIIYLQNPRINSGNTILNGVVNSTIKSALPPVRLEDSVNPIGIILEFGAYIWCLGIIILLTYSLFSYFRLKSRLSTATLVDQNVFETDRITSPFVMGFIKPKIYLPIGLLDIDKQFILLHERVHIKRLDYLVKPFALLATAIHWFNPLMWISYKLMSKDMEMSCDEKVLKAMGEDIRIGYSNTLLSFSEKQSGLLSPLAFGENNAKSRIKNVLNYKRPTFWVLLMVVVAVIAMSIALMSNQKVRGKETNAQKLYTNKTQYVGNNSKVGSIINALSFPDKFIGHGFELQTSKAPYGITMKFTTDTETLNFYKNSANQMILMKNAAIMFSLVNNVGTITVHLSDGSNEYDILHTRENIDAFLGKDVREYAKTQDAFSRFLLDSTSKFQAELKPKETTSAKSEMFPEVTKIEIKYSYFNNFENGYHPFVIEDKLLINTITHMMGDAVIVTDEEAKTVDRGNNPHATIILYKKGVKTEIPYIIDDLYSKNVFEYKGIHYSTSFDLARLVANLEGFRPKSGKIEKSVQDLLNLYNWSGAFLISSTQVNLPDNLLQKAREFPTKLYWNHNLQISKDIGLDFSSYLGKSVTAELYCLINPLPKEFFPRKDASAVILKQNGNIIGAYINAGRHSGFACSLKRKSFEKVTQKTFEKWIVTNGHDMKDQTNIKNSKLRSEEVVVKYLEAINRGDNSEYQYVSTQRLVLVLFSNMDNTKLYNPKWSDGNTESMKLLKIEKNGKDSSDSPISFNIEVDIKVKKVVTMESGTKSYILTLVKEGNNGWKINDMGN